MNKKILSEANRLKRKCAKDFKYFVNYYFKHDSGYAEASFHQEIYKTLSEMVEKRGTKLALAAPRGSGKTTIITLWYILFCIINELEKYIVLFSATRHQAETYLESVKTELSTNERLREDFPEICETEPKPSRWTKTEIITQNKVKITALGAEQQIRGRRFSRHRPSLIILDDLESDDKNQSLETIDKLHNWLQTSVLKAGDKNTNFIIAGTIHHYHSLLARYTDHKQSPGWKGKIYQAVKSWAVHEELWAKWREIYYLRSHYENENGPKGARHFFEKNKAKMLEGTEVLWKDKNDYYQLMELREEDGYISFDAEMQNEPVNPKDCLFKEDEITYWSKQYASERDLLIALGDNAEFFGACDPSLGRYRDRGDFTAIITIVRDKRTNFLYLIDADIKRKQPDEIISAVLSYCKLRKYRFFGFESNNFQDSLRQQIVNKGREQGIYPPINPIQNSRDKRRRIELLQPIITSGCLMFNEKHDVLLKQLKYFPKGNYDDGPDALEMAVSIATNNTSSGMPPYEERKKVFDHLLGRSKGKKVTGYFDPFTGRYIRIDDRWDLFRRDI